MAAEVAKRAFNVDEYYRMAETGILSHDDHVELIEGEIIEMSPIGSFHAACIDRLIELFTQRTERNWIVRIQSPVRLNDYSEPEPDVMLLRRRGDFYQRSHPTPADVLLVIEVADSSVDFDRHVIMPLYARAGIPEVWIAILPEKLIEVYAQLVDGVYQEKRLAKRGDMISPTMLSDIIINVDDVLG